MLNVYACDYSSDKTELNVSMSLTYFRLKLNSLSKFVYLVICILSLLGFGSFSFVCSKNNKLNIWLDLLKFKSILNMKKMHEM